MDLNLTTIFEVRARQEIPDLGPDTTARRRLRDVQRADEALDVAVNIAETASSLNPMLPSTNIDLDPTVRGELTPIGDSGWYWSGNEPVDPRDCDLWPNSPYCSNRLPVDPLDAREVSIGVQLSINPCETCVIVEPQLFGISGPPTVVCKRSPSPECQVAPPPRQPAEDEDENSDQEIRIDPVAPPGKIRICYALSLVWDMGADDEENYPYENGQYMFPCDRDVLFVPTWGGSSLDVKSVRLGKVYNLQKDRFLAWGDSRDYIEPAWRVSPDEYGYNPSRPTLRSRFMKRHNLYKMGIYWWQIAGPARLSDSQFVHSYVFWTDVNCNQLTSNYSELIDRYRGFLESNIDNNNHSLFYDFYKCELIRGVPSFYGISINCQGWAPPANQPMPTPPQGDDMGCCDETLELLEAIYSRLGVEEFPVRAPALLVQEGDSTQPLENHAQLWEWTARNLDAVMGQFPIKLKIKDSDPTTEGNQEVELELPNVAETLAEMFGLAYQSEIQTDLITDILLRLIPEVLATKNASLTGQSYAKANASFLGYPANAKEVDVDYNFDLERLDSLPGLLSECRKRIVIFQDESRESVLDVLSKLEFAAGIIKASLYTKPSDKDRLLSSIESMIEDEALSLPNKEKWRDWLQRMNRDSGKHNRDQPIQPEIIEDLHEGIDKL